MPESNSIVRIYVKQHQTLPIFNLVFDPMTLTYSLTIFMLLLLLKIAKDSGYSSDIVFDTDTDYSYKENSFKSFEAKK